MARVLDAQGRPLSPCPHEKARKMLAEGKAALVSEDPLTIRLPYTVNMPTPEVKEQPREPSLNVGSRVLLHVCCGPCSTYPINWLREQGCEVTGLWYNPNIHPWREHELRRTSAADYAEKVGVEMIWAEVYEMPRFFRLVAGHERFRERCHLCYQLRLEWTARVAAERGFDAFTTTLLISPHQDQKTIHVVGEAVGRHKGVPFLSENFRRGWSERGRLTKEHDLYRQQYCGCLYSEWERYNNQSIDVLLEDVTWIWKA